MRPFYNCHAYYGKLFQGLQLFLYFFIVNDSYLLISSVLNELLQLNLASNAGVTAIRSRDKQWLYIHLCKSYNNEAWQDCEPACANLELQLNMTSPPLIHFANIYGLTSNSISVVTISQAFLMEKKKKENQLCGHKIQLFEGQCQ